MITYLFAYKKKKKQTLGQVWATFFKQEIWLIIKLSHTKKKKIIKDKFLLKSLQKTICISICLRNQKVFLFSLEKRFFSMNKKSKSWDIINIDYSVIHTWHSVWWISNLFIWKCKKNFHIRKYIPSPEERNMNISCF